MTAFNLGSDLTNQSRSTTVYSSIGTISGAPLGGSFSITGGGEYSVNGGAWSSSPSFNGSGTDPNGWTVQVRITTSPSFGTAVSCTLDACGGSDTFSATTLAADADPDHWTYTAASGLNPSTVSETAGHTLTGMNSSATFAEAQATGSVTGPQLSVNGGAWASSASFVQPADSVRVRGTSPSALGGSGGVSLVFDGVTVATFAISTRAADITPNSIAGAFTDQGSVATSTLFTSNAVTITGMDAGQNSPVTFPTKTNGTVVAPATNAYEVNINGAGWVNATGTLNVQNGQTIQLRMGSNGSASVTATFVVDVNGVQDTWTVTTTTPDTTPDAFTFADNADVAKGTVATSNIITIAGITAAAAVSFSTLGGSAHEYRKNGGAWTAVGADTVVNGDTLQVRATVPATALQTAAITMTVGGVSDTYTATAQEPDSTPTAFAFTPATGLDPLTVTVSAPITVAGINTAAAISVSGGEYSVNGAAYTSSPGTVNLGDSVTARGTTASGLTQTTTVTVIIGGVAGDFNITTRSPNTSNQYVYTFREAVFGKSY